jgi:hypothetical protein
LINSKERFLELFKPEYYIRVDDTHPLDIFIGINSKRQKSFMLKGRFNYQNIKGTSSIEVKQYKLGEEYSLVLSLNNEDAQALFYIFCDDLIEETRKIVDVDKGYKFVINRFLMWKKMFVTQKSILSEPEIIGLIGELMFLKDFCFNKYGVFESINGWSAMEPTHKDFSFQDYWYEVKSKNEHSQGIKISSIEQLDSDAAGELVVFDLEKMSPEYKGIKLNSLIVTIKKMIENVDDSDLFDHKLTKLDYSYNDEYDNYCYVLKKRTRYIVKEGFPRISRDSLDPRVDKVQYEIAVNSLTEFIIEE